MANHSRVVELLDEERMELERLLRSQTSASGLVRRARAVLLMADGQTGAEVARLTGYTPVQISRIRRRFSEERTAGLSDKPRSGRPRIFGPRKTAEIVALTLQPPTEGLSHWSTRELAAAPAKLLSHVLLLELLDRVPVEPQLLGHVLDRRRSTSSAHVHREALGVQGIVREKGELLALHSSAAPARNPADPHSQKDPRVRARQVPHLSLGAVVEDPSRPPARRARRFFERRTSEMTRA